MARQQEEDRRPDFLIILVVLSLLVVGLTMILSASSVRSYKIYGDSYYLFKHQLIYAGLGIISMLIFMQIDYHSLQKLARLILILTLILLILVLIPGLGIMVSGSRRWLSLGIVRFQPTELAKIGLVIYLADFFVSKKEKINSFVKGIMPVLIVMSLIFYLIMLEPDLGTAVILGGIFFIMLFVGGARLSHIFFLSGLGLPLTFYFIISEEYRKQRLLAFLNPWSDPLDSGYHIIQALLALGSGGLFGVGLGNSRQKFLYLPEPGTDFIFAVLGEELGLIGTLFILLLYFILAWRGIKISLTVPDDFGQLLAVGLTMLVVLQAIINIGVVTASLPITGITLPFISYGGTSLLIMMTSIGILLNISKHCRS